MSISFGRDVLRPSFVRRPAFNSLAESAATYDFACVACHATLYLDLLDLRGSASDASIMVSDHADAIREHFYIGIVGKSHDGGWPRFAVEACHRCGTRYLVYLGWQEPNNGIDVITVQGIVELRSGAASA
jgi:hypothetical protein